MFCKPFHPNVEVLRSLRIPPEILQIIHKYFIISLLQTIFFRAVESHQKLITFTEYLLLHNSSGVGLGIDFSQLTMQNNDIQLHMDLIIKRIIETRNLRNDLLSEWGNMLKSSLPSGSLHGNKMLWRLPPFLGDNLTPEIFATIFKVLKYDLKFDFGDYEPFEFFVLEK